MNTFLKVFLTQRLQFCVYFILDVHIPKKSTDYVKKLFLNNMNCYQQLEQSFEMKKIEINQLFIAILLLVMIILT
ncbi:hypothetical protein [Spiroplasma endosymbiont of Aleiodes alternator]|uniref:hypothetical protein n=1 Tax=Spiroplasma endosymbiont of Aleiodes alternator TaxID=3139329 RepID=UPI003CCB3A26